MTAHVRDYEKRASNALAAVFSGGVFAAALYQSSTAGSLLFGFMFGIVADLAVKADARIRHADATAREQRQAVRG